MIARCGGLLSQAATIAAAARLRPAAPGERLADAAAPARGADAPQRALAAQRDVAEVVAAGHVGARGGWRRGRGGGSQAQRLEAGARALLVDQRSGSRAGRGAAGRAPARRPPRHWPVTAIDRAEGGGQRRRRRRRSSAAVAGGAAASAAPATTRDRARGECRVRARKSNWPPLGSDPCTVFWTARRKPSPASAALSSSDEGVVTPSVQV